VLQGMDERDPHLVQSGRGAADVNITRRAVASGPHLNGMARSAVLCRRQPCAIGQAVRYFCADSSIFNHPFTI
jgi:hypothetical protein